MPPGPFHAGELEAQQRAGVGSMAAKVGRGVHHQFPSAAAEYLAEATLIGMATTDAEGRPWASLLAGEPGFVAVSGPVTAIVSARPAPGDPLASNLVPGHRIGLIAPDLATRRRLRLNGTIGHADDRGFTIQAEQVYANCPKYIQRRITGPRQSTETVAPLIGTSLTEAQRDWLRRADTFFIATSNPGEGADASHRGGAPGFITVAGDRIRWPDYSGNMMFNTIGNVLAHPWAGIAVPDFAAGSVLLLSGPASINWNPSAEARSAGAERVMQLDVDRVIELAGALPLWAGRVDFSPFNPPLGAGPETSGAA